METATQTKYYSLPELHYGYGDLAPFMSEEQLKIHHTKHHNAYITGGNALLEKMDKARKDGTDFDVKATLKELSWNAGGNVMHNLFWGNLTPMATTTEKPTGMIAEILNQEFGSYERFRSEFTKAALSVEGSGWAAMTFCRMTQRPIIMQVEKHSNNMYPMFGIMMVLDMFEHAYYIDYKNDKAAYVENFWKYINWETVNKRLERILAK